MLDDNDCYVLFGVKMLDNVEIISDNQIVRVIGIGEKSFLLIDKLELIDSGHYKYLRIKTTDDFKKNNSSSNKCETCIISDTSELVYELLNKIDFEIDNYFTVLNIIIIDKQDRSDIDKLSKYRIRTANLQTDCDIETLSYVLSALFDANMHNSINWLFEAKHTIFHVVADKSIQTLQYKCKNFDIDKKTATGIILYNSQIMLSEVEDKAEQFIKDNFHLQNILFRDGKQKNNGSSLESMGRV